MINFRFLKDQVVQQNFEMRNNINVSIKIVANRAIVKDINLIEICDSGECQINSSEFVLFSQSSKSDSFVSLLYIFVSFSLYFQFNLIILYSSVIVFTP